jgi:hypothetical protein
VDGRRLSGQSLEVLLNTYGHHHPDYLSDAVEKIAKAKRRLNESQPKGGIVSWGDNRGGGRTQRAEAAITI